MNAGYVTPSSCDNGLWILDVLGVRQFDTMTFKSEVAAVAAAKLVGCPAVFVRNPEIQSRGRSPKYWIEYGGRI